ncbi:MAG: molybdopterin-binding protein, partial [Desulfobulbaceae bacterium]
MLTTLPVEQAVGIFLAHDITEIVKDSHKGRAFRKGHIIRQEDIDHLKRLGKDNIYILTLETDE